MKSVTFILPPDLNNPVGGYKIVYEYANRLTERGWQVKIGYDCRNVGEKVKAPLFIKKLLIRLVSELRCVAYPTWFRLSERVKKFCIYNDLPLLNEDNLVATAYPTADIVAKSRAGNKLYLIQDFENWEGVTTEEVIKSYNLGMKNIAIASWLKDIVDDACGNNKCELIPNGIDNQEFYLVTPIKTRKTQRVSMLYHKSEHKGSIYGIRALIELKKMYPKLEAVLFGVPKRPEDLPEWIEYVQKAAPAQLREIYDQSQVFMYPAIEEGFGLTCVESMACGCALCVTDYRGAHEFAVDGDNAVLSPVKDAKAMVNNVRTLLDDDELRIRIAENGKNSVEKFAWEKSVGKFENLLVRS